MTCALISGSSVVFSQVPVPAFVLIGCGEREKEEQNSAPLQSSAFANRLFTLKAFWSVSSVLSRGSSLCPERLEMDEAVLLRRVLRFSPCRFLHQSSLRLSLLYFNLVNNL